jgi:pimeloyl-ACP methyl ester carboxylesterase
MPTRLIAEGLLDLLPTPRLMVIDGAGHMGPLTHTAEVCALIMRHIVDADERALRGDDTSAAEILDAAQPK